MQESSNNNPYNPLFEVAALTISTKSSSLKTCNRIAVDCALNFNRSQHLTVPENNIYGKLLHTITFSLSIRNCILRLFLEPEQADGANFSIKNIGHLSSGYLEKTTELQTKNKRLANQNVGAKGTVYDNVGGEITYNADISPKYYRSTRSTAFGKSVNGTFSDRKAAWEIGSNVFQSDQIHREFIQGEIFRNITDNKKLTACIAEWKSEYRLNVPVSASVFVKMSDVNIGDVAVINSDGELVNSIANSLPSLGTALKLRLAKQAIGKFLRSSGSVVDGQLLEICRAHA